MKEKHIQRANAWAAGASRAVKMSDKAGAATATFKPPMCDDWQQIVVSPQETDRLQVDHGQDLRLSSWQLMCRCSFSLKYEPSLGCRRCRSQSISITAAAGISK